MQRGRPTVSQIRQNIVEILFYLEEGYGYQISKIYQELFSKVTQRSIYYQLRKGLQTKEIIIKETRQESGNFSWGSNVEKKVYALGSLALPKGNNQIKEYLQQFKK
jgi:hypothetical protein